MRGVDLSRNVTSCALALVCACSDPQKAVCVLGCEDVQGASSFTTVPGGGEKASGGSTPV